YDLKGDNWIFATDEYGELLDVKSYAAGQTVTLLSTKHPGKINVTYFQYRVDDFTGDIATTFNTWAAIPRGTRLHLVADKPAENGRVQSAMVKVSGVPLDYILGVSSSHGNPGYGAWFQSGDLRLNVAFEGAPCDILFYGSRAGEPV